MSKETFLTPEEIQKAIKSNIGNEDIAIAQAATNKALKEVMEWGDDLCPHAILFPSKTHKRECVACWQELKEKLKG